tara:strand:+ start:438 stop:653 length:216 start_codon:yes stop_codon:yes gene_type:complete
MSQEVLKMMEKAAEDYQEKMRLLKVAEEIEDLYEDLRSEVGDRCGWVSEEISKIISELHTEMDEMSQGVLQ